MFLILVLVPVLGLHPLAANAEVVVIRADRLVDTERGSVLPADRYSQRHKDRDGGKRPRYS
ncbi:MAG: hypothetical protein R3D26_23685 [Cyanobacteriota/Melainabacteria group bacterium]